MITHPAYQFALILVTYAWLVGALVLTLLIWPFRHRRGAPALLILVSGLTMAPAWLITVDILGMVYGHGVLPAQPIRALVSRLVLAAAVWLALFTIRGWRP